jgi:SIR2-like domain
MATPTEDHYDIVASAICEGDVVPFLGAGANFCGRDPDVPFQPKETLPSATALGTYLAERFPYPGPERELLRVAQYAATMLGTRKLNQVLHEIFDADFEPTPLHTFLAQLPTLLSGAPSAERPATFTRYQLIVTTNYDDTLERAFVAAGEPFDLISYKASDSKYQRRRGSFYHWPSGNDPRPIEDGNSYGDISLQTRTVILKVHGLVVRAPHQVGLESFVITEDHYIDYLAHASLPRLLPVQVLERLTNSNLLFLGYALKDWNLRVILQGIWSERDFDIPSWAVQIAPDGFDEEFWSNKDVKIFDADLADYVEQLDPRLRERAPSAA